MRVDPEGWRHLLIDLCITPHDNDASANADEANVNYANANDANAECVLRVRLRPGRQRVSSLL